MPEIVVQNASRRRILELINLWPGATLENVSLGAELSRGATKHHLHSLVTAGLVRGRRLGREIHLLPYCIDETTANTLVRLNRGRTLRVFQTILLIPGISQAELAERVQMTRKILGAYLSRLVDANLIRLVSRGRFQSYIVGPALTDDVWRALCRDPMWVSQVGIHWFQVAQRLMTRQYCPKCGHVCVPPSFDQYGQAVLR